MSGLAGRTVVVTRPREEGERLTKALASRGARPVSFPMIAIRPLADPTPMDDALIGIGSYDWIVFTSAHAVAHVWSRLEALGVRRLPSAVRVAAVGPATSYALESRGVHVSAVPNDHRGTALPAALGGLVGRRVLLPRADIGREETISALRIAGAEVLDITAYHTIPAAPDEAGLAALRAGADAVTFTSPSTARNFAALLGREAQAVLSHAAVACIGPTTADAVRHLGIGRPLLAAQATTGGIVDLLDGYFGTSAAPAGGAS